jgi:hypothetical protein
MRKISYVLMVITGLGLCYSCGNSEGKTVGSEDLKGKIQQQADGTISLKVENADCYSNKKDPSDNTAEWSVEVSKSGHYDVWISSATTDTMDLRYKNSILISFADNNLEAKPECDRIVRNSKEVNHPYYKADSFLGSVYVPDPGLYYVQVVSEKILPSGPGREEVSVSDISKLISVSFTPSRR